MLSQELEYTYVKFPNEEIDSGKELRRIINGGLLFDLESYQELQNKNKLETLEVLPDGNYIFDRYKLSEIVYGKANGLPDSVVNEYADRIPDPDITILIVGRPFGKDKDIFSADGYQRKVKELYKEAGKNADGRVIRVCNYNSPEKMLEKVLKELWRLEDAC
jgi:thymidylate kinase